MCLFVNNYDRRPLSIFHVAALVDRYIYLDWIRQPIIDSGNIFFKETSMIERSIMLYRLFVLAFIRKKTNDLEEWAVKKLHPKLMMDFGKALFRLEYLCQT